MLLRRLHQAVVGGMEFDQVDALAKTVVGLQPRPVAVGVEADAVQLVAGELRVLRELWDESSGTLASDGFAQDHVIGPQIARLERWRLVVDRVGFKTRKVFHHWLLLPNPILVHPL